MKGLSIGKKKIYQQKPIGESNVYFRDVGSEEEDDSWYDDEEEEEDENNSDFDANNAMENNLNKSMNMNYNYIE